MNGRHALVGTCLLLGTNLILSNNANAAPTRFCVEYDASLVDVYPGAGDDFFTNDDAPVSADGVYVKVVRNADKTTIFEGYTEDSGTNAGCTSYLSLSSTESYGVVVSSKASITGNTFEVRDDPTTMDLYLYAVASVAPLPTPSTITVTTPTTPWWNIAAAARLPAQRVYSAFSGKTITLYPQSCPTGGGSCAGESAVFINGGDTDNKYVIAHELGHTAARTANGGLASSMDYTAPATTCTGGVHHSFVSKEYQSAAVAEGLAHFLAAWSFNDNTESDCVFVTWGTGPDWDRLDPDPQGAPQTSYQAFSCEASPVPDEATGPFDYLGETCDPPFAHHGNEYDWLRFWWDFTTDGGVDVVDCLNIWAGAGPDSWNPTDTGLPVDFPPSRLEVSAAALGFTTPWQAYDNLNGVMR